MPDIQGLGYQTPSTKRKDVKRVAAFCFGSAGFSFLFVVWFILINFVVRGLGVADVVGYALELGSLICSLLAVSQSIRVQRFRLAALSACAFSVLLLVFIVAMGR